MERKITHILCVFLLCLSQNLFSQISDDFSDGNFTSAPSWSGNDADFVVNTGLQLQLNSSGAGTSYLATINTQSLDQCEWNFWISLAFSPSGSNYARVYLVSTQAALTGTLNGYYLQFGENGSADRVELFRQNGTFSVSVCRGVSSIAAAFSVRIKVTRSIAGLWEIFMDPTGGNNYLPEASGTDSTVSGTAYFGVYCKYTSSNAAKFYFDDFYIYAPPDTIPPRLDSARAVTANRVDVFFNEPLDTVAAQAAGNYTCSNGIGTAASAVADSMDASLVHLSFASPFISGTMHTLTVTGMQDASGNAMTADSKDFIYYDVRPASVSDIIINEVLFDPYDGGVEWVEIYNRSDKIIDLAHLSLANRNDNGALTNIKQITTNRHLLFPNGYCVLSKDQQAIKAQYATPYPDGFLDMDSFIYLNNDSASVVLIDSGEQVIDDLQYHAEWHLPMLNETKGVSLERINHEKATQDASNWHSAAESAGYATPAFKNSQYTDGEGGDEITVMPEVFSPDNDGYNDVLSISYAFDVPGRIGNVHVYDSQGRLEKTLVRNELLGTTGTFFWDGLTDAKLKARMGIYILYIEVFDKSGVVKKYKKTCVVGGRF